MKLEYLLIKKRGDEFCRTEDQFKNWLQSNSKITIEQNELVFREARFAFNLSKWSVEQAPQETVFHLVVTSESTDDRTAEKLDEFDTFLARVNETNGRQFVVNTVWDDASAYYGQLLYPRMVRVENLLRAIIYQLMIRSAGTSWFDNSVPEDVKKSISETLRKNGRTLDETGEDQLYYADFIQLGRFLFDRYTLKPIGQRAIDSIRKALGGDKDDIERVLHAYTAKSNWERYFEGRISVENLNDKWTKLYGYRNQVAHAKQLKKGGYKEAVGLVDELTSAFEGCLEKIDEIKMTKEESEAAQEFARETVSPSRTVIRDNDTGRVLYSSPSAYTIGNSLSAVEFKAVSPIAGLGASLSSPIIAGMANADRFSIYPERLVVEPSVSALPLCTTLDPSDSLIATSMLHRPTSIGEVAGIFSDRGEVTSPSS